MFRNLSVFSSLFLGAALAVLISCKEATSPAVPQSLAFGTENAALLADDSLAASATVTMSDGSVGSSVVVSYSSSNTAIATVDSKGLVRAIAAGTATITARVGSLQDDFVVAVSWAPISGIKFSVDTATVLLDDTLTIAVVVTNSHNRPAPNAAVTYASANPSVATVDSTGRIRALSMGTTTLVARDGTVQGELKVTVAPHFLELALGGRHTCGITGRHELYCWGFNLSGELGVGGSAADCSKTNIPPCSLVPIPVTDGARFVSVTLGFFHACALTASGVAYCWGGNFNGGVGIGTTQGIVTAPALVVGGHTFVSLGAGFMHTCGITTDGDTYCWGMDNSGQLGAGVAGPDRCDYIFQNSPCSRSPIKVVGGQRFVQVTGSDRASCGRTAGNMIYCWGLEVGGPPATECDPGRVTACTRSPLLQVSGSTFPIFGMGNVTKCGQLLDGTIRCWGADFNNFGNGSDFPVVSSTPVVTAGGKAFQIGAVAFGANHVCGIISGNVECWGDGTSGQVGGFVNRNTPGPVVVGGIAFTKVFSGSSSGANCGIATTGRAYCWGLGVLGQLGNNSMEDSAVPVLVQLVR